MSSFKQGKFYFDDLFNRLWKQTPIHFAGQEFDAEGMPQWINPTYRPSRSEKPFISNFDKVFYATLYIPCWADNDVDVMGLMDDVTEFIEDEVEKPYKVHNISVIDHGWDDSNKVFGIIMVSVSHTSSFCIRPSSQMLQFTDDFTGAFQI